MGEKLLCLYQITPLLPPNQLNLSVQETFLLPRKVSTNRWRKLFLERVLKIFWVPRLGAVSVPFTPSFCGVGEFACLRPKVEFANSNEQALAAVKKSEPRSEGNGFP